jgi:hypothetical protein
MGKTAIRQPHEVEQCEPGVRVFASPWEAAEVGSCSILVEA